MTVADGAEPTEPTEPIDRPPRLDHLSVAVLGLVTIAAYGSWYYAFGVLFDPILADTGWSESTIALAFSIGIVANGFASMAGGRVLDRAGSRVVLLIGGLGGGLGLLATSVAPNPVVFALVSAVAMGLLGGFGFYHVTMTCAVRLNPDRSARAIAVLTIWGAFASAIYLPSTAALVDRFDWRVTVRILAVVVMAVFLMAATVLRPVRPETTEAPASMRRILLSTIDRPERRAFTLALALGWVAMSTILVYQVPVMTAAGLPLATAATVAGLRGFSQTAGRIPLGPIVERLGSSRSVALALGSISVSGVVLAFSGRVVPAVIFALLAGFGIGAMSPLQGIVVEELFDRDTLGATMGSYGLIGMGGGAIGPALAGILADTSGSRRGVTVIIVVCALVAAALALRIAPAQAADAAELGGSDYQHLPAV
ncbi:MAG: MFS transporter, partial [Actinomycetota bacterium]